ncbi:MAG: alanyl-tRNA synthetase [Microgenomates group bacterium Gr01-1014_7]|nr:MAG: alanyl-tRNA synthetase [Microgenomates group bacterium Gr01-1014_7]
MDSKVIRQKFIDFFKARGHKEIAAAKLVLENDPTTLFTSSGMQPLVPYLLAQEHPEGKRLVNSQPCFRAEDIEEVGDNRHTTFFEMLGNWSLGDYFKEEQLNWCWELLTKELGLPKEKLYVSLFEGDKSVPKDMEAYDIWKSLGVADDHIFFYGVDKNWWSRSGPPNKMPPGEIGGPDSEVFFEFTQVPDNPYAHYYNDCHPNCNCGRFLEIGNSVFIQYQKQEDGSLKELSQKNVDFGGGLERLVAAVNNNLDMFESDLFSKIINSIENISGRVYQDITDNMSIIADHVKAATFLIASGVTPSNKLQGYVLRRLLRRVAVKFNDMCGMTDNIKDLAEIATSVIDTYEGTGLLEISKTDLKLVITDEMDRFSRTLDRGLKEIEKIDVIDGKKAFELYQTFGFPLEVIKEIFKGKGKGEINQEEFEEEFKKHQELSRTASSGMFKGGLADHSEIVTKYHTATHLLHQALRDVLGPQVFQQGSNITAERLRFDFSYDRKMTDEEIKHTEDLVNQRIKEDLKVDHMIVDLDKAKQMNAIGLFDEKYADKVSIYGVGPGYKLDAGAKDQRARGGYYSLEFCGGPHVKHSGIIGRIKITKEEATSAGVRRIRAEIVLN